MKLVKGQIFLSYARDDDEPFVKRLFEDLTGQGFNVWWDRVSMPGRGLTFRQEIRDAIGVCERLILVIGPDAIHSPQVKAEWEYAFSLCKPISPVLRLGSYDLVPSELKLLDIPDFREDTQYKQKLAYLLRQLEEPTSPLGNLNHVPPLPAWYIERSTDLELTEYLRLDVVEPMVSTYEHQSVTLYGLPGIGKSVFASAVAHDCDIRRTFTDGIFWIELGKYPDLPLLQSTIGNAFGDKLENYPDAHRGKARLASLLSSKSVLIILDDVWNHSDVEAFHFAGGQKVRFLIVTRNRQIGVLLGGVSFEVGRLSAMEGMMLIAKRLRLNNDLTDNYPFRKDHLRIVQNLSGHTQAISIAASQLARRGEDFAPELSNRIAARLVTADPFQDLTLTENEDRQLNLEISLALTYEDLRDELKACFRSLGVFVSAGAFDAMAASRIIVVAPKDVDDYLSVGYTEDMLDELVDAALVIRHENRRYSLHRVIKSYALALLKRGGEAEATLTAYRFVKYYADRASNIFQMIPEYWHIAEYEFPQIHEAAMLNAMIIAGTHFFPDILHVLEAFSQEGVKDVDELTLIISEVFAKITQAYISLRNIGIEGLAWLLAGLAAAKTLKSEEIFAELAESVGDWYERHGEPQNAVNYYGLSIKSWLALEKRSNAASGLIRIAALLSGTSRATEALEYLDRAAEWLDGINDEFKQAEIWGMRGAVYGNLTDYAKAVEYDCKALQVWERLGNKQMEASALNNIGVVYFRQGSLDKALNLWKRAYSLVAQLGDKRRQATCLLNMADAYEAAGNDSTAMACLMDGIGLIIQVGDPQVESILNFKLARIFWKLGEHDAALRAMEVSRRIKVLFDVSTEREDAFLLEWRSASAKG